VGDSAQEMVVLVDDADRLGNKELQILSPTRLARR
jgi:hypothetical protein